MTPMLVVQFAAVSYTHQDVYKRQLIAFDFYEMKDGKLKTIVVYTKHARGLVVRFCAENQAKTLNEVKAFNLEGYRIDEELSSKTKLVFTR